MTNHLKVGDRTFDGFCVINHANPDCGFFALVTTVLNSIRIALQNNWRPVVNIDKNVSDYFYDQICGEEIWGYYFEPLMGLAYEDLCELIIVGEIDPASVHYLSNRNEVNKNIGLDDPDYITHFWVGQPPKDPIDWMVRKRELGREFVSKYVRVKPHIKSIVEQFFTEHLASFQVYGVHIRGTDFGYAEPTKPETYFKAIREKMENDKVDNIRIFLATDQQQFVRSFKKEFGDIVVTYDSTRSESEVAPFQFSKVRAYKKGEDVLIDALLMSKCNFLFKCASAVGEYALWFNASLECKDFGLDSQWDPSHTAPASLKLNVNESSYIWWKTALTYKKVKRIMLDLVIGIGRRVLPVRIRDWLWLKVGRHLYFFK